MDSAPLFKKFPVAPITVTIREPVTGRLNTFPIFKERKTSCENADDSVDLAVTAVSQASIACRSTTTSGFLVVSDVDDLHNAPSVELPPALGCSESSERPNIAPVTVMLVAAVKGALALSVEETPGNTVGKERGSERGDDDDEKNQESDFFFSPQ